MYSLPVKRGFLRVDSSPSDQRVELKWGVLFLNDSGGANPIYLRGCRIESDRAAGEIAVFQDKKQVLKLCFEDEVEQVEWFKALKLSSRWKKRTYYTTERTLVDGKYGRVFLAKSVATGDEVAMKKSRLGYGLPELLMMDSLDHPNILSIVDAFVDRNNTWLILPFMEFGTLSKLIKYRKHLDEDTSRECLRQILSGMEYLRSKGIIHMDMKPDNILVSIDAAKNIHLKIADFGASLRCPDEEKINPFDLQRLYITPPYAAPELQTRRPFDGKVDMFAVGAILIEMHTGKLAFDSNMYLILKMKIINGLYRRTKQFRMLSDDAKSLIKEMVEVDASRRVSVDDALNHPWMCTN